MDYFSLTGTESVHGKPLAVVLVDYLLLPNVDFDETLRGKQPGECSFVEFQRIRKIKRHTQLPLGLELNCFLRNLPTLALDQLEEAMLNVLKAIAQESVGLVPAYVLFKGINPIP